MQKKALGITNRNKSKIKAFQMYQKEGGKKKVELTEVYTQNKLDEHLRLEPLQKGTLN